MGQSLQVAPAGPSVSTCLTKCHWWSSVLRGEMDSEQLAYPIYIGYIGSIPGSKLKF